MSEANAKRSVWITGASSGIGSALVEAYARHGDHVFATARSEENLRTLQRRIQSEGGICEVMVCDVREPNAVDAAAKRMLEWSGQVDVLINNAGVTAFKEFAKTSLEEFDRIVQTNLRGIFLVTSAVLPSMVAKKNGMIINVLSFATKSIYERSAAYTAAKAGAEAMMNVLRAEVRRSGIRVVNISPGAVSTPIWHARHLEKFRDQMLAPEDVARAVYDISIQPDHVMIEELIIRPQEGDLHI
jgi:NADP-dependent 3-hydroxy acid dehydrogenase YdfG